MERLKARGDGAAFLPPTPSSSHHMRVIIRQLAANSGHGAAITLMSLLLIFLPLRPTPSLSSSCVHVLGEENVSDKINF